MQYNPMTNQKDVNKPELKAIREVVLQIDILSYYRWQYRYHDCSFPKSTYDTKTTSTLYLEPSHLQLGELNEVEVLCLLPVE